MSKDIPLHHAGGPGEHQDLLTAGCPFPKAAYYVAIGHIAPMKAAIPRRTFREPDGWNVNRLAALFEPPGQPFATGEPAPDRAIKSTAKPSRDHPPRTVHCGHRFKRRAHLSILAFALRGKGCRPAASLMQIG
jgi:hypothetical protein